MDDVSIIKKAEFAPCPRCGRLMDASMRDCPHCRAFLTKIEVQSAATRQRETSRKKSRINDRNALIYGIFSLAGLVVVAMIWLAAKLRLWRSQDRADVIEIAGHVWLFVRSNLLVVAVVFGLLPVLVIVIIRLQRR